VQTNLIWYRFSKW